MTATPRKKSGKKKAGSAAPKAKGRRTAKAKGPGSASGKAGGETGQGKETAESAIWEEKVIERLLHVQKLWIEMSERQVRLTSEILSRLVVENPAVPSEEIKAWAKQAIEGLLDVQRQWSGAMAKQSEMLLKSIPAERKDHRGFEGGTGGEGVDARGCARRSDRVDNQELCGDPETLARYGEGSPVI